MTKTWLTEARPEQFEGFLATLWSSVRADTLELPDTLPQGVGELPAAPWPVGYAIDRAAGFAALRWYQRPANVADTLPLRCEAFFLTPASATPRIGLRVHAGGENAEAVALPQWWTDELKLPGTAYVGSVFPGFIELTALLAARGNIATSSADMLGTLTDAQWELEYYRELADSQAEENRQLRAQLREMAERPFAAAPADPELVEVAVEPPTDLSGLPVWVAEHGERITVMPRALYGAKKSRYQDPGAVYTALEFLAGPYRDHRMGKLDRDGFNSALAATGLQLAGSAGVSVAGEQGDAYFVHWGGRRRFMDLHLLKGGGRDERYCMRVYFFWDDETQQAIVGWLPSHLSNSLS